MGISLYFCRRNSTEQKLNSLRKSSNQVLRASTNMEGNWKYFEPYHSTISFSLVCQIDQKCSKFTGCETYAVFEFAFTDGTFVSGCFLSFFVFRLETANLSVFRLETTNYYSWYFNWYLIKSKNIVCSFMHRIPTAFCTY